MSRTIAAVVLVIALTRVWAQTPQRRDLPPTPVPQNATGVIAGAVWSADQPPQPVRRAVVTLAGGGLTSPRSTLTNDAGEFTFSRLPAGTFTVTARKAAYIAAAYGSLKPGRPGSQVTLTAGQHASVAMTMFKGAVIGGTLQDPSGMPVVGITVTAMDARTIGVTNVGATIDSAVTDDRGVYRIYGLLPGDYLVSATPPVGPNGGDLGARTSAEMDALLAGLAQRSKTAPTATPTPLPTPPPVGFAPVYYPGTPLFSDAAPVHVGPGEERLGASFELSHVRVATLSGTVSGGVPNLAAVQLSMIIAGPRAGGPLGLNGITASPPNAQGEFKYGNLPPGQYRIIARVRRGATETANINGGSSFTSGGAGPPAATLPSGGGSLSANPEQLFAVADVTVRGDDITGVGLTLQPGGTISGKLAFDAAAATIPSDFSAIRIGLSLQGGSYSSSNGTMTVGNAVSQVNAVGVGADGTFQVINIGPGPYTLNCQLPQDLLKVWKLRSAVVDGRDLLDAPIEGPNLNLTGVTLTLSDKRTEISGALQVGAGQSASDYYVVVFSADRANWRVGARRSVSVKPGTDNRYVLSDLPAGDYYLAALTDLDPLDWQTPASLEQIVPFAIKLQLGEGEKLVRDFKIGGGITRHFPTENFPGSIFPFTLILSRLSSSVGSPSTMR